MTRQTRPLWGTTRRGLVGGAVAASAVGGMGRAGAQPAAARKLTIKGAAPSLTIAAPLTMIADGIDKRHGLAVDLQASGTSSTITIDAVLAGQAQFGTPGTADALQAIRQGARLRIVAAVVNNLQVMAMRDDVIARTGVAPTAPIADRVRALKGLTVGTGAVGSTHYQVLRAYMKQYGIDPDRDVRLVGTGDINALIVGIEQRRYDAIAYASPIVEQSVARKTASIWISAPRGDIPGSDNVKMCVVVTRSDTLEQDRAGVDALRAALQDAIGKVRDDHEATGRMLHATYFPNLDPAVWATAWGGAVKAYPASLAFPREAYDYWINADAKGPDSYKGVDYAQVVYAPAQSS